MRRTFAALCLAAAAATGIALAPGTLTPNADTTWGAPHHHRHAVTVDGTVTAPDTGVTITPLDTTWG